LYTYSSFNREEFLTSLGAINPELDFNLANFSNQKKYSQAHTLVERAIDSIQDPADKSVFIDYLYRWLRAFEDKNLISEDKKHPLKATEEEKLRAVYNALAPNYNMEEMGYIGQLKIALKDLRTNPKDTDKAEEQFAHYQLTWMHNKWERYSQSLPQGQKKETIRPLVTLAAGFKQTFDKSAPCYYRDLRDAYKAKLEDKKTQKDLKEHRSIITRIWNFLNVFRIKTRAEILFDTIEVGLGRQVEKPASPQPISKSCGHSPGLAQAFAAAPPVLRKTLAATAA
ncbi:MAG: hypothetical protein ACHP9Y_05790, partial [Gammaproteobacteria bacterium]